MISPFLTKMGILLPHTIARRSMFIHDITVIVLLIVGIIFFLVLIKLFVKKDFRFTTNAFIILFLLILWAPLLQQYVHIFQFIPVIENRNRVALPKLSILPNIFIQKNNYTKDFEKYFNDNFGFRDDLIRLKNQIDYTFFHYSDEVLIGKDNWLFYKEEVERDEVKLEKLNDAHFIDIQNKILALNERLKKGGITFVVMPIPEKNSVYPELMTQNTTKRPRITRLTAFLAFFESHPEIIVMNVPRILEQEKQNNQLYLKTDFHWNDIGAYITSQKIVTLLAKASHTPVMWKYPLNVNYHENFTGGQNNSLAIFFPTLESEPSTETIRKFSTMSLPVPQFLDYHFKSNYQDTQILLPKTVLLGNSFSLNFINAGLFDHFTEIYYLRNYNMKKIDDYIPDGTRIVIWQIIEVNLLDENLL